MCNLLGSTMSRVPLPKTSCASLHHLRHHYKKPCYLFAVCIVHLFGKEWVEQNECRPKTLQRFLRSKHYILAACLICVIYWAWAFREVPRFSAIPPQPAITYPQPCFRIVFSQGERNHFGFAQNWQMTTVSGNITKRLKSIIKDCTSVRAGRTWWVEQEPLVQKIGAYPKCRNDHRWPPFA